jgi:hypothetical protein
VPYRQGQMVAGDYYRAGRGAQGDLFGFIGKALGGVAKVAGSFLPGPIGTIGKAVGSILAPSGVQRQNPIGATLPPPVIGIRSLSGQLPVLRPDSTVTKSGFNLGPLNIGSTTTAYGHLVGKKRRRMNVTNVKALRRAGRRVKGFEKLARRFVGFAAPHKPKGRMYFKSRKRS